MVLFYSTCALALSCSFISALGMALNPQPLTQASSKTHALLASLNKPSKTISVGVEYSSRGNDLTQVELETLSMNLRKVGASALYTSDLTSLRAFVKEQATSQGSFPGPLPVIYEGSDVEAAMVAGATSVILPVGADLPAVVDVMPIYCVSSPADVIRLYERCAARAFMIEEGALASGIIKAVDFYDDCVSIVSMASMQAEQAEVVAAQQLQVEAGLNSVLLRESCVGDSEDIEYSNFAISALTKKRSKTFNMSGLTASANGHGGGVARLVARTWLRNKNDEK